MLRAIAIAIAMAIMNHSQPHVEDNEEIPGVNDFVPPPEHPALRQLIEAGEFVEQRIPMRAAYPPQAFGRPPLAQQVAELAREVEAMNHQNPPAYPSYEDDPLWKQRVYVGITLCILLIALPFLLVDTYMIYTGQTCIAESREGFRTWFIVDLTFLILAIGYSFIMAHILWNENTNSSPATKSFALKFEMYGTAMIIIGMIYLMTHGSWLFFYDSSPMECANPLKGYMWFRLIYGYMTLAKDMNRLYSLVYIYHHPEANVNGRNAN